MRVKFAVVTLAAALALAGCKEEKAACTPEQAQAKATAMMTKMQELATSNPEKLAAVGARAQELQADLGNAANDPAKACAAVDELMKVME